MSAVNPKSLIVAAAGRCIIAVGSHCWGKGPNALVAITEAKKHGKPTKDGWRLFDVDASGEVDDMGNLLDRGGIGCDEPRELGCVR